MISMISKIKVVPCGHSIGLSVLQKELIVVDFLPVMKLNGLYHFPAREEGIKIDDVILEVEGRKINSLEGLCKVINETMKMKETVQIALRRHGNLIIKNIRPFYHDKTKMYKLGIKLKALATGLGTLTFYDPNTRQFCAFGHPVNNLPLCSKTNNIMHTSTIHSIKKGRPQCPGTKIGCIDKNSVFTGLIHRNCTTGIYGTLSGPLHSPFFPEPIPVVAKKEIRAGKALFYTVVDGSKIERFELEIQEVNHSENGNKDIRLSILDENLIRRTGGIILGMSGSPIVQNEKIIGAISFLSFNNSLHGYAVSLENMLRSYPVSLPA